MKRFFIVPFIGLINFSVYSQTKGTFSTTKLVNVDVMKVSPEKPPKVSLVFRAETPDGESAWDLKKEDLIVREDSIKCDILSLEPISKNKPISIGMVIDHSGSMGHDYYVFYSIVNTIKSLTDTSYGASGSDKYSIWDLLAIFTSDKDTVIPLEHAKRSARTFVSSFNAQKDFISAVGFGETVDLKIPLNNDTAKTNQLIGGIKLGGSTALYDGMMEGMKQLKKAKGVKVLVALTDGQENASKSTLQNILDYSIAENIPIYIIGLGGVNESELSRIADTTNGMFFYSKKSSSLAEIYKRISKQIQSFYAVEYISPNVSRLDKKEQVKISFDVNSIYLLNDPADPEVIEYIKKKEFDRKLRKYGKIAIAIIIVAGTIVLIYTIKRRKRRTKESK